MDFFFHMCRCEEYVAKKGCRLVTFVMYFCFLIEYATTINNAINIAYKNGRTGSNKTLISDGTSPPTLHKSIYIFVYNINHFPDAYI